MTRTDVAERLQRAIQKLTDRDLELLRRDVNERSITHRLGTYMQEEFPEWDVDCEYNRKDFNAKKLDFYPNQSATDDTDARTVFPDIIVHKRGPAGPNLLVVEAKKIKDRRQNGQDTDRRKLRAFNGDSDLKYEHAVFLQFRTGKDARVESPEFID
jgi:hypothetical protein